MCSTTNITLCFTFLNFLLLVQCAPELPVEDSYGIVATEWAIRNTLNHLFSTLKLKVMQQKLKLKQYSTIHNFLVSITLRDHDNLKKIAKLTEVENIDNGTQVFITQLNEVLDEDNKSDESTDSVYVKILIEEFVNRLDNFMENHELQNNTKFDLNKAILRHFNNHENEFENSTYLQVEPVKGNNSDDDNVLGSIESWEPNGRRIFNGTSSNIKRFPFMASVQFFKKFECGGSIVKSDLVITSASCLQLAWNNRFFRENPAFLSVQIGSTLYENGGENIPVLELYFHPGYNPKNLRHNLALMRLTRRLQFSRKRNAIKKINFDKNPWALPDNTNGIVIVGWGARTFGTHIVNLWKSKLSFSTLDFYPLSECQEVYTKDFVTERNFCAGFFSKGGGACNHDAGGPGIVSGTLAGVISFGSPVCGTPDAPTVFTKLGYYTDWIEEIMDKKVLRGHQPTTLRPYTSPKYSLHSITKTTPFIIRPILRNNPPKPLFESLRTDDKKHEFKDFLKTMFKKKKEITQRQKQEDEQEEEETEQKPEDIQEQEETEQNQEDEQEEEETEQKQEDIQEQEETEQNQEDKQEQEEETEPIKEKKEKEEEIDEEIDEELDEEIDFLLGDKSQDLKEVDKFKSEALRNKLSKPKTKSNRQEKVEITAESTRHELNKSNPKIDATKTKRPSSAVVNQNLKENEDDKNNVSNRSDKVNENEKRDNSEYMSDEEDDYNHENEPSKEVVHTINKADEKQDYETDDGGETEDDSVGLSIPDVVLKQEHSSNSTERLIDMMEYEDIYDLLSGTPL